MWVDHLLANPSARQSLDRMILIYSVNSWESLLRHIKMYKFSNYKYNTIFCNFCGVVGWFWFTCQLKELLPDDWHWETLSLRDLCSSIQPEGKNNQPRPYRVLKILYILWHFLVHLLDLGIKYSLMVLVARRWIAAWQVTLFTGRIAFRN